MSSFLVDVQHSHIDITTNKMTLPIAGKMMGQNCRIPGMLTPQSNNNDTVNKLQRRAPGHTEGQPICAINTACAVGASAHGERRVQLENKL